MEENTNGKTLGKVIKITLTVSLFLVIGALIFRMCQASHKALEETAITPAFKEAYKISDTVSTHAINDEFSENGAVWAYSLVYIEKAGYMQFTVRYNIRHIEEVQNTYPNFKEESIRYELTSSDGTVYKPNIIEEEKKFNYHYFKMEFTGVDFSSNELSINMILDGIDINVGEKSTLVIHRKDDTFIPYDFTSSEYKDLKK